VDPIASHFPSENGLCIINVIEQMKVVKLSVREVGSFSLGIL